jgi:hypothetical protein
MSLPIYNTLIEAEADGLLNITSIAKRLGKSRQCVHAWHRRRKNTHFPMPKAQYKRDRLRVADLFEWDEVESWKRGYVRNLGGRVATSR